MKLFLFSITLNLYKRLAPYLVMTKGKQLFEEDVRVAGFNILLLKEITAPLFIVAMGLIIIFMFVTGGDGLIFRICHERRSKNELKSSFKNDGDE